MSRQQSMQKPHSFIINSILDRLTTLETRIGFLENKAYRPESGRSRSRSKKRYYQSTPKTQETPSQSINNIITQMEQLVIKPTPVFIPQQNYYERSVSQSSGRSSLNPDAQNFIPSHSTYVQTNDAFYNTPQGSYYQYY